MSKLKSTVKIEKVDTRSKNGWDRAIVDSENLIYEYQEQISLLKASVRSFKILRERGAPFPQSERTSESGNGLLGQDEHLGQSPLSGFPLSAFPLSQLFG